MGEDRNSQTIKKKEIFMKIYSRCYKKYSPYVERLIYNFKSDSIEFTDVETRFVFEF
jgi:hypothetical protein